MALNPKWTLSLFSASICILVTDFLFCFVLLGGKKDSVKSPLLKWHAILADMQSKEKSVRHPKSQAHLNKVGGQFF